MEMDKIQHAARAINELSDIIGVCDFDIIDPLRDVVLENADATIIAEVARWQKREEERENK